MTKDFARIPVSIPRISRVTSTIFLTSGNSRKGSRKFMAVVPLLPNNGPIHKQPIKLVCLLNVVFQSYTVWQGISGLILSSHEKSFWWDHPSPPCYAQNSANTHPMYLWLGTKPSFSGWYQGLNTQDFSEERTKKLTKVIPLNFSVFWISALKMFNNFAINTLSRNQTGYL